MCVCALCAEYQAATAGEVKEAKGFLILNQLVMHSGKEEAVFYPAIRQKLENGNVRERGEAGPSMQHTATVDPFLICFCVAV